MAKLIAQSGHSLDLPRRRVTLGESSACDIPLATGLGLAARHFEIEPGPDGDYVVRDVSEGVGTMVNGQPVQEHVLHHGNVIMAGGLRLGFWNTDLPQQEAESPFLAGARRGAAQEPPTIPTSAPVALPFTPLADIPVPAPAAEAVEQVKCTESPQPEANSSPPVPALPAPAAPVPPAGPPALPSLPTAPVPSAAPPSLPVVPTAAEEPSAPKLPASEGPPLAWVNPAALNAPAPSVTAPSVAAVPALSDSPKSGKRRVWSRSSRKLSTRRTMIVAALVVLVGGVAFAASTAPAQKLLAPLWNKATAWFKASKPAEPKPLETPAADTAGKVTVAPDPGSSVTPRTNHNDLVKRMLTERTLSLFQADLTQLVPFYNSAAGARNLPPQREMTEAFRKHYGILLDGFDRLTCLRAKGRDEFVFVLSSSTRMSLESVLGIPPAGKDSPNAKGKSIRIYPVKTAGRVYGVAQYDPFTVILGNQAWIESSLNSSTGPSLREALCMFPETACRKPGGLIMVERIVPPDDSTAPSAFATAVSNLFFKGKGESRLTLTRSPDVKESLFVEQSSSALKEQASALMQAVKVSEALMVHGPAPAAAPLPADSGEIITTAEASIVIPDGEALLREAIDSVAYTFMSQSPSVELILAAQKAVMNFNQARLKLAPEAQAVTSVAEALELIQSGITIPGQTPATDRIYQIERLESNQADEIIHLLAMEDKVGLVFRPSTDRISGTLLDLAVKARDYRNAELLISLWTAAKFTGADTPDVNAAVRKVVDWAGNAGSRQRISVGLPSLTADEYKNAVGLLSVQNGQLTWKPGEEGYRTWLRRISPDPKADAKRIAGAYDNAIKAGAIPQGKVESLADAVRLIHSGVRSGAGTRSSLVSTGNLSVDELRAAARYLRYDSGALRVVER